MALVHELAVFPYGAKVNKDRLLSRLGMTFLRKKLCLLFQGTCFGQPIVLPPFRQAPSPISPSLSSRVSGACNWPDYDAGLQQRGSLTVWFTPQAVEAWYYQGPRQRGAQYTFSEVAIQTALILRLLYHLPLRQTEGFVASILALMGIGGTGARSHDPIAASGRLDG